jgi:protoheme IX farnesyltransferase
MQDPLYFPREQLASALTNGLQSGITHAFTLFAPRRMGKTQFLLRDIAPLAERQGFNVFYFSFMDGGAADFIQALNQFARTIKTADRAKTAINAITKLEVMGIGIERQTEREATPTLPSQIIGAIAEDNCPSLLLLDEVQELARKPDSEHLIRSLRTGLDIHQRQIKTIFTGSSTNGLRAMFNDNKAPFFHFAHALDFPTLNREFTDFLADIYQDRTGKTADKSAFYRAFEQFSRTPLYMRATVQDMIINPDLTLEQAAAYRLREMHESSGIIADWQRLNALEQLVMRHIAQGHASLYGKEAVKEISGALGTETKAANIQAAIRKLERKDLITKKAGGMWTINRPLMEVWINENTA